MPKLLKNKFDAVGSEQAALPDMDVTVQPGMVGQFIAQLIQARAERFDISLNVHVFDSRDSIVGVGLDMQLDEKNHIFETSRLLVTQRALRDFAYDIRHLDLILSDQINYEPIDVINGPAQMEHDLFVSGEILSLLHLIRQTACYYAGMHLKGERSDFLQDQMLSLSSMEVTIEPALVQKPSP
jgi:hypothetical protein